MRKIIYLGLISAIVSGCGAGNTRSSYQMTPTERYLIHSNTVHWSRFVRVTQRQVEVKVDAIDPTTFTILSNPLYGKDKNYVYYKASPMAYADINTFTIISSNFTKDSKHVFLSGEVIPGADPASFKILSEGIIDYYSKDKNSYYYGTTPFSVCDEKSFTLSESLLKMWATDSQCAYNRGIKLEGAQMSSFKLLPLGYAKDSTNVYHLAKRIPEADAASFDIKNGKASDKNNCYQTTTVIDCATNKPKLMDMSAKQIDKAATDMAMAWLKDDLQKKQIALTSIPQTARAIALKYNDQTLTPADVKNINLASLPIGYLYTLKSTVPSTITDFAPRTDAITYKLSAAQNNQLTFDVIHPKNFGYLLETRLSNGKKNSTPLMSSAPFSREYFTTTNCEFELGECQFTAKVDIDGTPFTYHQTGTFDSGVWTYKVTTQTGKVMTSTFVYDKSGLPLYMSRYVEDSLHYELERQNY